MSGPSGLPTPYEVAQKNEHFHPVNHLCVKAPIEVWLLPPITLRVSRIWMSWRLPQEWTRSRSD